MKHAHSILQIMPIITAIILETAILKRKFDLLPGNLTQSTTCCSLALHLLLYHLKT